MSAAGILMGHIPVVVRFVLVISWLRVIYG